MSLALLSFLCVSLWLLCCVYILIYFIMTSCIIILIRIIIALLLLCRLHKHTMIQSTWHNVGRCRPLCYYLRRTATYDIRCEACVCILMLKKHPRKSFQKILLEASSFSWCDPGPYCIMCFLFPSFLTSSFSILSPFLLTYFLFFYLFPVLSIFLCF